MDSDKRKSRKYKDLSIEIIFNLYHRRQPGKYLELSSFNLTDKKKESKVPLYRDTFHLPYTWSNKSRSFETTEKYLKDVSLISG